MSSKKDAHRHQRDKQWSHDQYNHRYQQKDQYEQEYEEDRPRRRRPQRQYSPNSAPLAYRSPVTRSSDPPRSRARQAHVKPRQSSAWPALMTGCAIGVILAVLALATIIMTGMYSLQNGNVFIPLITSAKRMISKQETLTVPLSSISQIVICDMIGDVFLKADPTVSKPTVSVTKHVQATSQTAAEQQFQHLVATIQPPETITEPLSCTQQVQATATPSLNTSSTSAATTQTPSDTLTINVTMPTGSSTASVDLTISLPPSILPANGPSTLVNIETAGNISVNGVSGIMNIKSDTGNPNENNEIKVTHAALADGSKLATGGDIIFNGYLAQASDPNKTAFYTLEGEKQIQVTLPSTINLTLEAYAVNGIINSQFPLQKNLLQKDKGTTSYHGLLNASGAPPVNAQLTLHVGLGNVNIQQAQSPTM